MFRPFLLLYDYDGGGPIAMTDRFVDLAGSDWVDDVGRLKIVLDHSDPMVAVIGTYTALNPQSPLLVELWYCNPPNHLTSVRMWRGMLVNLSSTYERRKLHTYTGVTFDWLLTGRRHLYPYDDTASSNSPAETHMKFLIEYNLGDSALTTYGRFRDGTWATPPLVIETDSMRGNTLLRPVYYLDPLLAALQDLAIRGGLFWRFDFDGDSILFDVYEYDSVPLKTGWKNGIGRNVRRVFGIERENELRAGVGLTSRVDGFTDYYRVSESGYYYDREDVLGTHVETDRSELDDAAVLARYRRRPWRTVELTQSPIDEYLLGYDFQIGNGLGNLTTDMPFESAVSEGNYDYFCAGWKFSKGKDRYHLTLYASEKPNIDLPS